MGSEENHTHDYRYVETIAPSCTDLGFEYWQCDGCGRLEKRNYTLAAGHSYEDITIREATCKQGGLVLTMCKKCGDFHETTTPTGVHTYLSLIHILLYYCGYYIIEVQLYIILCLLSIV